MVLLLGNAAAAWLSPVLQHRAWHSDGGGTSSTPRDWLMVLPRHSRITAMSVLPGAGAQSLPTCPALIDITTHPYAGATVVGTRLPESLRCGDDLVLYLPAICCGAGRVAGGRRCAPRDVRNQLLGNGGDGHLLADTVGIAFSQNQRWITDFVRMVTIFIETSLQLSVENTASGDWRSPNRRSIKSWRLSV